MTLFFGILGIALYQALRPVRFVLRIRFLDKLQVLVLLIVHGMGSGLDDYAISELTRMGSRAENALSFFAKWLSKKGVEPNVAAMVLDLIAFDKAGADAA